MAENVPIYVPHFKNSDPPAKARRSAAVCDSCDAMGKRGLISSVDPPLSP